MSENFSFFKHFFYYAQVIIIGFLRELRYFKGKVKASNILNGMKHILVTGFSLSLVCVVEAYSLLKKCILIIFLPVLWSSICCNGLLMEITAWSTTPISPILVIYFEDDIMLKYLYFPIFLRHLKMRHFLSEYLVDVMIPLTLLILVSIKIKNMYMLKTVYYWQILTLESFYIHACRNKPLQGMAPTSLRIAL